VLTPRGTNCSPSQVAPIETPESATRREKRRRHRPAFTDRIAAVWATRTATQRPAISVYVARRNADATIGHAGTRNPHALQRISSGKPSQWLIWMLPVRTNKNVQKHKTPYNDVQNNIHQNTRMTVRKKP